MFNCYTCKTEHADSATFCWKCKENGGTTLFFHEGRTQMVGIKVDPNLNPYGSTGSIGYLESPTRKSMWFGNSPTFRELMEGVECRQVAGVLSYITGVGWMNDLDLGLVLLMEAQE